MGSKPDTPEPTAQELEAERRARRSLDELTREENERLKGIKRRRRGRQTLLGSGSELGILPGMGAAGVRPGGSGRAGTGSGGGGGRGGGGGGIRRPSGGGILSAGGGTRQLR